MDCTVFVGILNDIVTEALFMLTNMRSILNGTVWCVATQRNTMEPLRKTAPLLWRYILEEKFKSKL